MTIREAQLALFGTGRHLAKRIQRLTNTDKGRAAATAAGLDPDQIGYGLDDPYTDAIAAALNLDGPAQLRTDGRTTAGQVRSRLEDILPADEIKPRIAVMMDQLDEAAIRELTKQEEPQEKEHQPEEPEESGSLISARLRSLVEHHHQEPAVQPQEAGPVDKVFGNQRLLLCAFMMIGMADGESMRLIAYEHLSTAITTQLFFFLGGWVVAYAGLKTAYDLHRKNIRTRYDLDDLKTWLTTFAVYQGLLHASAFHTFGSWNGAISKAIVFIGLTMATAALAWASLGKKEDE